MNQKEYVQAKGEIEILLIEKGCFIYNTETDEFLKGIVPVVIDFSGFSEEEQIQIAMVASWGELDLNCSEWTDGIEEAHKVDTLLGLYYAITTLIWEGVILKCTFLVENDSAYNAILSLPRDDHFINRLLDEFE